MIALNPKSIKMPMSELLTPDVNPIIPTLSTLPTCPSPLPNTGYYFSVLYKYSSGTTVRS